ncbi:MAG: DUF429 domain-containing protein [Acidimicrobiales bacterium]
MDCERAVRRSEELVAGLDGCRAGWVMALLPTAPGGPAARLELVDDLHQLVERLRQGLISAAAIDIPIGLPATGPRPVDVEARRLLGPRRNSVFPAPVRSVLQAENYVDACDISRAVSGRAISRQLFAILPKIREVDDVQTAAIQDTFFEMHPELSFAQLAGAPMRFHKRTREGRRERLDALRDAIPGSDALAATRVRGSRPDDVLDALVGAWTAGRYASGTHVRFGGGEVDERGLRMEVVA